ncbi:MAG: 2-hydroxyacyl-CoA dehydratase subunit D [Desulfosudaceae bacterium]
METPLEALHHLKQKDRPVIGCLPLYPPLELLHSLGLAPVVLWGLQEIVPQVPDADRHIQNYACSVARRLTQFVVCEGRDLLDGLFFYNAGDTLRNLPEILREGVALSGHQPVPQFRLHVPMNGLDRDYGRTYLQNGIQALIADLEARFGGQFSADRFAASVDLYARLRQCCRDLETAVAEGRLGFVAFCRLMRQANFMEASKQLALLEAQITAAASRPAEAGSGPRLLVSGILPPPVALCEMMDSAGLTTAGNDIAFLRRSYAGTPDPDPDPAGYYTRFYRDHFPCPTLLHTAGRRAETLLALAAEKQAEGVLFVGEKFCEYEYFDLPYLEKQFKAAGLGVLTLEIAMDDDRAAMETARTRLEAFTEILTAK